MDKMSLKHKEIDDVRQCSASSYDDGWLKTEFKDIKWNLIDFGRTRELIFLDVPITESRAGRIGIISGHADSFSEKGLFCLAETKWEYDSSHKYDRVICGTNPDKVKKFSRDYSIE